MRQGFAFLLAGLATTTALAQPAALPPTTRTLAQIEAMRAPDGGLVTRITLLGDPDKPGVYVQILKIPPHGRIAPHHHSADRISTVLKGEYRAGFGAAFDVAALKALPAGSLFTEPAGIDHYGEAGDDGAIVEVTGTGPVTTIAVKP